MRDTEILDLYWAREERAISETQLSYGNYCYSIAWHILYDREDSDECVNDTWLRAWNAIPPKRPNRLAMFLGTITRNLSLDRWKEKHTMKRGKGEMMLALDELAECVPDVRSTEEAAEAAELERMLNDFLHTLPERECNVFLRRYWYVEEYSEIARRYGMKLNTVKTSLFRTRAKLREYLERGRRDIMKNKGHGEPERGRSFSGENRQGRALRLMEALSGVDEELLERSDGGEQVEGSVQTIERRRGRAGRSYQNRSEERRGKRYKSLGQYAKPWAAVLCLAVAGVLGWGGYQLTLRVDNAGSGANRNDMSMRTEYAADAGGAEAADEAMPREVAGLEEEGGEGADALSAEKNAGAAAQTADSMDHIVTQSKEAWDEENNDQASPEKADRDNMNAGTNSGSTVGKGQDIQVAGNSGNFNSQETEAAGWDKDAVSGEAAISEEAVEVGGCPPANLQKLTEKEARKQKELGPYIPETIPGGYAFESAFSNLDQDETNLTVVWTRGMDSISWSVVKGKELPATVDIDKSETYDLRLYEVPYGETVPQEYRQSVDNPVFSSEDFDLEIVRSRMALYADLGDTDTPRGRFSVLYPDDVVVSFNGRGTAEEIWEMFASLEAVN